MLAKRRCVGSEGEEPKPVVCGNPEGLMPYERAGQGRRIEGVFPRCNGVVVALG